jgi:hypothetical protein
LVSIVASQISSLVSVRGTSTRLGVVDHHVKSPEPLLRGADELMDALGAPDVTDVRHEGPVR